MASFRSRYGARGTHILAEPLPFAGGQLRVPFRSSNVCACAKNNITFLFNSSGKERNVARGTMYDTPDPPRYWIPLQNPFIQKKRVIVVW